MLENLKPEKVFKYFEEISMIPRCSGNEKGVSDYMVKFAKDRNLEVIQDSALNIIIKKSGTKGYENSPITILQGHLDMVGEKNGDTIHDFDKDPLKLYIDGDLIKAHGTTLGADNGVAVAMSMAILDSDDIPHPPLEVVMTTDEEVGLLGAGAIDANLLKGRLLLNLDSDGDGIFLTSCAGGLRTDNSVKIDWTDAPADYISCELSVKGLAGGHSGAEIILDKANSNVLMGRILYILNGKYDIYLKSINGGLKDNAIPRECVSEVFVSENELANIKKTLATLRGEIFNEYKSVESEINFNISQIEIDSKKVFSKDFTKKLLSGLQAMPNGVYAMSKSIDGLVETSNNIGIIRTNSEFITISSSIRSSVLSRKLFLLDKHFAVANLMGGELTTNGDYPGWEYEEVSPLREICLKSYKELYNKEPIVTAIHAGLECGIFSGKMPGLDMIAFGPDIHNAHTPDEALGIASLERVYNLLLKILENLK